MEYLESWNFIQVMQNRFSYNVIWKYGSKLERSAGQMNVQRLIRLIFQLRKMRIFQYHVNGF